MPSGDGEEKINTKTKKTQKNTKTMPITQYLKSQCHAYVKNRTDSCPHRPLQRSSENQETEAPDGSAEAAHSFPPRTYSQKRKFIQKNITSMVSKETGVTFEVALLTKVRKHPEVSIGLLQ